MPRDHLSGMEPEQDVLGSEGRKTARRFLDFEANGVALGAKIHEGGYDLISCLWADDSTAQAEWG